MLELNNESVWLLVLWIEYLLQGIILRAAGLAGAAGITLQSSANFVFYTYFGALSYCCLFTNRHGSNLPARPRKGEEAVVDGCGLLH